MKFICIFWLFWGIACNVVAQQIPYRPQMTVGVLPNGMTYYIAHNEHPTKDVNFWLLQKTGSCVENRNEIGIAHFVEHMLYHETKHFMNNGVSQFLRENVMSLGEAFVAETRANLTEYPILHIRSNEDQTIDSCLMLIKDWCCSAVFSEANVEKEKNIIKQELGMRKPLYDENKLLSCNFGTSGYGHTTIGTYEDIEKITVERLSTFYTKWYQPQLQAIVVSGDIDEKIMQEKIKKIFADIPKGKTIEPSWTDFKFNSVPTITKLPTMSKNAKIVLSVMIPEEKGSYQASVERCLNIGLIYKLVSVLTKRCNAIFSNSGIIFKANFLSSDINGLSRINIEVIAPVSLIDIAGVIAFTELRRLSCRELSVTDFKNGTNNDLNFTNPLDALANNDILANNEKVRNPLGNKFGQYWLEGSEPDTITSWDVDVHDELNGAQLHFHNEILENCKEHFMFGRPLTDMTCTTLTNMFVFNKITPELLREFTKRTLSNSNISICLLYPEIPSQISLDEKGLMDMWNNAKNLALNSAKYNSMLLYFDSIQIDTSCIDYAQKTRKYYGHDLHNNKYIEIELPPDVMYMGNTIFSEEASSGLSKYLMSLCHENYFDREDALVLVKDNKIQTHSYLYIVLQPDTTKFNADNFDEEPFFLSKLIERLAFMKLREEKGLIYSAITNYDCFIPGMDTELFNISIVCNSCDWRKVVNELKQMLNDLIKGDIIDQHVIDQFYASNRPFYFDFFYDFPNKTTPEGMKKYISTLLNNCKISVIVIAPK